MRWYLVLVLVLVTNSTPITAQPPSIPEVYYGYAILNGNPAPINTSISVEVTGTGEVVGTSSVHDPKGHYVLKINFDMFHTEKDEGARSGDRLIWKIDGIECTTPSSGEDTATPGGTNEYFIIGVGEIPFRIADHKPYNTSITTNEGEDQSFSVDVINVPGENTSYVWTVDGIINSTNPKFTHTSSLGESGTRAITVEASNGDFSVLQSWNLKVNRLPVIDPPVPDITVKAGITKFNLTPHENDYESENKDLVWTIDRFLKLVTDAKINPETDILTITTEACYVDFVRLTLTDANGGTDTQEVRIVMQRTWPPDGNCDGDVTISEIFVYVLEMIFGPDEKTVLS